MGTLTVKEGKKIYFKVWAIILAVLFVIVAAIFIIRYPILGIALVEDALWEEIIKYLFGWLVMGVICCTLAFVPITWYVQRLSAGLIQKKEKKKK